MKLNLGSGQNKQDGFVNIDKFPNFDPDLLWDLETTPWPFEDESVEDILANHVLEHLGQTTETYLAIIKEMYRVLVPDGTVHIVVPHVRHDNYWNDPTHVRPITPVAMGLFSKKNCQMWAEHHSANSPLAVYLDVDFEVVSTDMRLTEHWSNLLDTGLPPEKVEHAVNTFWNVVEEITMVLRKIA